MPQVETEQVVVPTAKEYKLLSVARVFVNDRMNAAGTSPVMTGKMDRNLGIKITLGAEATFQIFANAKREGMQDAEYRVAVSLPADTVDREIARQKAVADAAKAAIVVEEVAPIA